MASDQFLKCIDFIILYIILTVYKNVWKMVKAVCSFKLIYNVFTILFKEMISIILFAVKVKHIII